jgi:MoaA/NifB/PqqE/SkfB family radical SAM enzyme
MDLQPYQVYVCCPSWCPTSIRDGKEEISWDTDSAIDIRKSVMDGSYRHCNHQVCPSLNKILNTDEIPHNFIKKEEFYKIHNINGIDDVLKIETNPEHVLFGFDRSCNLKCPSCRLDFVPNDDITSKHHLDKLKTLETIENKFSKYIKTILITGSGDPFYSNIYRNYLINFDSEKYPNLEEIKIITNGRMLNEKMWNKLSASKHIKSIEISIDAGTKYTYENVTRLYGDWDILIDNLKFISTIKTINHLCLSFVVSEKNYLEMYIFYEKMVKIFKDSTFQLRLNYTQHVHWGDGAYTVEEVEKISVFKENHPFFNSFINELKKISDKEIVTHNFYHLLKN